MPAMRSTRPLNRAAGTAPRVLTLAGQRSMPDAMLVYKVFRAGEFAAFEASGSSRGAPVDLADGYIHMSTAEQAPETLAKHFAGETGLYVLAVETDHLGDALRWEPSRGGALFPHLYRELRAEDVTWTAPIPFYNGQHILPAGPQ